VVGARDAAAWPLSFRSRRSTVQIRPDRPGGGAIRPH